MRLTPQSIVILSAAIQARTRASRHPQLLVILSAAKDLAFRVSAAPGAAHE